jgi:multimeric flavodoxin WrbA
VKLIIHDLEDSVFNNLGVKIGYGDEVISNNGMITPCLGCFGCWIRTPSICIIRDGYQYIGKLFAEKDEIMIISRCVYGGFSPFVKNVCDRSIGSLLPFFEIIQGRMHHAPRTKNRPKFSVCFYGDITEKEKKTAVKLILANAINIHAAFHSVEFFTAIDEIRGSVQ